MNAEQFDSACAANARLCLPSGLSEAGESASQEDSAAPSARQQGEPDGAASLESTLYEDSIEGGEAPETGGRSAQALCLV